MLGHEHAFFFRSFCVQTVKVRSQSYRTAPALSISHTPPPERRSCSFKSSIRSSICSTENLDFTSNCIIGCNASTLEPSSAIHLVCCAQTACCAIFRAHLIMWSTSTFLVSFTYVLNDASMQKKNQAQCRCNL